MDARYAATLNLVKSDTAQGALLKVNSTPTFFMNGMRLPGPPSRVLRRRDRVGAEAGGRRRLTSSKFRVQSSKLVTTDDGCAPANERA